MHKKLLFLPALALLLAVFLGGCGAKGSLNEGAVSFVDTPTQVYPVNPSVPFVSEESSPALPISPPTSSESETTQTPKASTPEEEGISPAQTETTGTSTASEQGNNPSTASITEVPLPVDIDLTEFSANMLYAEVYNMGMSPDDYKGKVISITGDFASFPKSLDNNGNPVTDEKVFVCLISDAMACCQSGIEFVPKKESSFWQERPAEGCKITITGICDIFSDDGGWFTIIQLNNAEVEWIK